MSILWQPLKTEVFRGFLAPLENIVFAQFVTNKELAILSEESLETQPELPEIPERIRTNRASQVTKLGQFRTRRSTGHKI
jgi:hypothetical protein